VLPPSLQALEIKEHDFVLFLRAFPATQNLPHDVMFSIFMHMDEDQGGSLDFDEFDAYFDVATTLGQIQHDPLMQARFSAAVLEMDYDTASLSDKPWIQSRLPEKEGLYIRAELVVADLLKSYTAKKINLGWVLGEWDADRLTSYTLVLILSHMFLMTVWASTDGAFCDFLDHLTTWMSFLYLIESWARIALAGGLHRLLNDVENEVAWANTVAISLNIFSVCFAVPYGLGAEPKALLRLLSSVSIWRIFFLQQDFRKMVYSLYMGFGPVTMYTAILGFFFLQYSLLGHALFGDKGKDDYGRALFQDLPNSMMTIMHLTIGDWVDIMTPVVERTHEGSTWFFVSYIVLINVCLANLFIGIIINMQKAAKSQLSTCHGKCEMAMGSYSRTYTGLQKQQQSKIITMIGMVQQNLTESSADDRSVRETQSGHDMLDASKALQTEIGTGVDVGLILPSSSVEMTRWAAARLLQAAYRRRKEGNTVNALKRMRDYLHKCNVNFKMVVELTCLAHTKSDYRQCGMLTTHEALGTAVKFLFRALAIRCKLVKYNEQWIDFVISNSLRPCLNMSKFVFTGWFFDEFCMHPKMSINMALPAKFFYVDASKRVHVTVEGPGGDDLRVSGYRNSSGSVSVRKPSPYDATLIRLGAARKMRQDKIRATAEAEMGVLDRLGLTCGSRNYGPATLLEGGKSGTLVDSILASSTLGAAHTGASFGRQYYVTIH